jgi:hypothetical protein
MRALVVAAGVSTGCAQPPASEAIELGDGAVLYHAPGVVMDDASIYWLTREELRSTPKSGGSIFTVTSQGVGAAVLVGIDRGHVVLQRALEIVRVPVGGGDPEVVLAGPPAGTVLVGDGSLVGYESGGSTGSGAIVWTAPTLPGATQTVLWSDPTAWVGSATMDANRVYWSVDSEIKAARRVQTLVRFAGDETATALTVVDASLYWIRGDCVWVASLLGDPDDTCLVTIPPGLGEPGTSLVVDEAGIFFANIRASRAGGDLVPFADFALHHPTVDAAHVYWVGHVDDDGLALFRRSKWGDGSALTSEVEWRPPFL